MTGLVRFTGPADRLAPDERRSLMERLLPGGSDVRQAVAEIIDAVREGGDAAIKELGRRFDRVDLRSLEVHRAESRAALDRLDPELRRAFERAARNVETAHRAWMPTATSVETEPGIRLERRPYPLRRVGVYAPGGRAVYPTSVMMGVIPAKVAGVAEIVLCSPAGPDGRPSAAVLAAAELAGADRIFAIGGAQAIAAMAWGTESVPRVDRIVGPGNAWVMEAKAQLASRVSIDSPAGPSEILVVADRTASAERIAAELVAQAEHDPKAVVVAVLVDAPDLAAPVLEAVGRRCAESPRREIIRESLGGLGAVLDVPTLEAAAAFASEFAAEHLLLAFEGAADATDAFATAGTVFVGAASSVAFGDYLTGSNHVLPTAGLARSYSGLSPVDFIRWTSYQTVTPEAAARLAADTARLAIAEGLPGHAAAALEWEIR